MVNQEENIWIWNERLLQHHRRPTWPPTDHFQLNANFNDLQKNLLFSKVTTPYPALGKAFGGSQNMTCLCLPEFIGSRYDPPKRLVGIATVSRHGMRGAKLTTQMAKSH